MPEKSIAILPFVDLSQRKDQEYFSDGVTEQIINSLRTFMDCSSSHEPRPSHSRTRTWTFAKLAGNSHVSHVLEGSVRHGPGQVRIDARLIDVANGYQLWSETYDSTEQDFLLLQTDVAKKVASALQIELHLAETEQLAKPPDARSGGL